jgi:NAD(P)H dehydrogenase (quinone)
MLRNGWYTENYAGVVPTAVQYGAVMGSAKDGSIAAASRAVYADMPQAVYAAELVKVGLPEGFVALLADSDAAAVNGGLFDDGKQLSQLIGRSATPISQAIAINLVAA